MNAALATADDDDYVALPVPRRPDPPNLALAPRPPAKQRPPELVYVERRLGQWRNWARENRSQLGYPTISQLYKALKRKAVRITTWAQSLATDDACNVLNPQHVSYGAETRSLRPATIDAPPAEVMEVDEAVAQLPSDLREVIIADSFEYGPIERRARKTRFKRARFCQLLESAKYAVYQDLRHRPCF